MKYDPEKWLAGLHQAVPFTEKVVPASCIRDAGVLGMQARVLGALFMNRSRPTGSTSTS
jgi:hypothetical protein